MVDSILNGTKNALDLAEDYEVYDQRIIMYINSVFSTLNELGVGPENGYVIEDASAEWKDLLGEDPRLNSVKSYVYLRVRMLFDPPNTGFHVTAMEKMILEAEWRINAQAEYNTSVAEDTLVDGNINDGSVYDGGEP